MSNPHQGPAVAHTIEDRRAMVRTGRLALVPQRHWENYPIHLEQTRRNIRNQLTCSKCQRRVYKTVIYWDIIDLTVVAIRKCWHCRHAWEL